MSDEFKNSLETVEKFVIDEDYINRLHEEEKGKVNTMRDKMTFFEFAEEIIDNINYWVSEEYMHATFELKCTEKENGISQFGIQMMIDNIGVTPLIYLQDFYKEYLNKDEDLDSILETLGKLIDRSVNNASLITTDMFEDTKKMKDNVFFRLYDKRLQSDDFLKETVTMPAFPEYPENDLIIAFYINVDTENPSFRGRSPIKYELLDKWNISKDELKKIAIENFMLGRNGFDLKSMSATIREMTGIDCEDTDPDNLMNVLKDEADLLGAGVLAIPSCLNGTKTLIGDTFYIIPSSVHELIILKDEGVNVDFTKGMIREINASIVNENEKLSDDLFYYDGTKVIRL